MLNASRWRPRALNPREGWMGSPKNGGGEGPSSPLRPPRAVPHPPKSPLFSFESCRPLLFPCGCHTGSGSSPTLFLPCNMAAPRAPSLLGLPASRPVPGGSNRSRGTQIGPGGEIGEGGTAAPRLGPVRVETGRETAPEVGSMGAAILFYGSAAPQDGGGRG